MTPLAHANYMAHGLLQLASYICGQVEGLEIDSAKFLASMSIPAGSGEHRNDNAGNDAEEHLCNGRISLQPWLGAPNRSQERHEQLLDFVDHMEKRSKIVPNQYAADYANVRQEIEKGALGLKRQFVRGSKKTPGNSSTSGEFCSGFDLALFLPAAS